MLKFGAAAAPAPAAKVVAVVDLLKVLSCCKET
jgi:hypothetical protein